MIWTALSSVLAFASTELDDFLLLVILFAGARSSGGRVVAAVSKISGMFFLCACSIFFSSYLAKLPDVVMRSLGFLPIIIGAKEFFGKNDNENQKKLNILKNSEMTGVVRIFIDTFLITLAGGGDNVAVYISFFAGRTAMDLIVIVVMFLVLQTGLCILACRISGISVLEKFMNCTKGFLVPALLVALGIYILLASSTQVLSLNEM